MAYARGGIPVYWIVNLIERRLEIHAGPTPGGYQERSVTAAGEEAPIVLAGKEVGRVPVSAMLPRDETRSGA